MEMIRQKNPALARDIDSITPAMRIHNMLVECKEIGVHVDASSLDAETVHLVYLIKRALSDREQKKAAVTKGVTRRGR